MENIDKIEKLKNSLFQAGLELSGEQKRHRQEITDTKIEWGQERDMLAITIHKLNIKVAERDCRIEELLDWVYEHS